MAFPTRNWTIHAAAKGGGVIAMDLSYLFYPDQCWAFGSVWCEAGDFIDALFAPSENPPPCRMN